MSKAILVIDMPNGCRDCACYDAEWGECRVGELEGLYEHARSIVERPSWCYLKEIDEEVLKQLGVEE